MSAMDLQTIRDFVLRSIDTDTDDIPYTLLDVFISEGFDNLISLSDVWDFYAVEDQLVLTAGQQTYNIAGNDVDRDPAFPFAYRKITDVRGETFSLRPVAHRQIRAAFRTTSPAVSRPFAFSDFGENLYVWPIPASAYTLQIAGYRSPIDWIALGAGAEPDAPAEFHEVVSFHALSRGYAQEGDPDMAGYYAQLFDKRGMQLKARYSGDRSSGPFVLNGGLGVDTLTRNGLGPLIYPFD